jgi:DNA-directed RNA polymerase specialized sigma24 family protein
MLATNNGSEAHDRVLAVLQENAASLLKIARLHSLCDDDAQDAYQRGLEIYLQRLDRVDPATAGSWLRTVVKHEAMNLRESRMRTLTREDVDFDELVSVEISSGEERAVSFERVTRAAEALRSCKRDEVAAMLLKADGHSYAEISSVTGWSYTKVNRCLSEGRTRFLERYAAIDSGDECRRLAPLLSMIVDGEATPVQMAEARPHLRNCTACRASLRELTESQAAIHVVLPAAVLLGASGMPDGAAGLFTRAYEMVVGGLQDRLALTALKAQQAVETMSASKVAVVASAAAVAGGGAMAVERAQTAPPPAPVKRAERPHAPRRAVARVAATPAPTVPPREVATPAAPRPERTRRTRPAATPTPTPAPAPAARPPQDFGFETQAPTPPAAAAAAPPAGEKPPTENFGFER